MQAVRMGGLPDKTLCWAQNDSAVAFKADAQRNTASKEIKENGA